MNILKIDLCVEAYKDRADLSYFWERLAEASARQRIQPIGRTLRLLSYKNNNRFIVGHRVLFGDVRIL